MSVVSMLQKQVETRAQSICQQRNQGLPAEFGKASYETVGNGVVFIKQHFLLDSNRCDYMLPVAKVAWNDKAQNWQLFMADQSASGNWLPYPFLTQSSDLTAIMREIDKDPKSMFWEN